MTWRGPLHYLAVCRRATAAIEFAIISAVFAPLSFAILEVAFILWTQNSMQSAATMAARCAAIGSTDCPDVAAYAATAVGEWLVPDSVAAADVSVQLAGSCNAAPGVAVVVTITHQFWSGISLPAPFSAPTISVTSCFPKSL